MALNSLWGCASESLLSKTKTVALSFKELDMKLILELNFLQVGAQLHNGTDCLTGDQRTKGYSQLEDTVLYP